jgi:hypothetical protein
MKRQLIMATDKLFKVVGISNKDGDYKVRFANDIMRIKVLTKGGHTDVRLMELDTPMSKMAAVVAMSKQDEFQDVAAKATIAEYVDRNTPRTKPEATPTATKKAAVKAKTPVKAKAKVAVTEDEDAPF